MPIALLNALLKRLNNGKMEVFLIFQFSNISIFQYSIIPEFLEPTYNLIG